jgi:hypothetical protein
VNQHFLRKPAMIRDNTGLKDFGERVSWSLFNGEGPLSSSPVSCPLPSLAWPLLNCPPIDPILSEPRRGFSLGARDGRPPAALLAGATVLLAVLRPPAKDCLGGRVAGAGGGAMEV